ncbi:hypothetical protein ACJ41O_002561 [Fusarium nematophilum]
MKSFLVSAALFAGLVVAQAGKLPSCAQSCVDKYTTGDGIAGCGQLEVKCICSNENFLDGIACCLEDQCDQEGIAAAIKYAGQICSSAGVDVPDEVVCKDKGSGSSTSADSTGTSTGTNTEGSASTPTESSGSAETTEGAASNDNAASRGSAAGLLGAAMAMLVAL